MIKYVRSYLGYYSATELHLICKQYIGNLKRYVVSLSAITAIGLFSNKIIKSMKRMGTHVGR
jgi:hypothetical protein